MQINQKKIIHEHFNKTILLGIATLILSSPSMSMDQPGDGTTAAKRVMADHDRSTLLSNLPQDMKSIVNEHLTHQQEVTDQATVEAIEKRGAIQYDGTKLYFKEYSGKKVTGRALEIFFEKHPNIEDIILWDYTYCPDLSPLVSLKNLKSLHVPDPHKIDFSTLNGLKGVEIIIEVSGATEEQYAEEYDPFFGSLSLDLFDCSIHALIYNQSREIEMVIVYEKGEKTILEK